MYSLNARPFREVEQWLGHNRVFWAATLIDLEQRGIVTGPITRGRSRRTVSFTHTATWTIEHAPDRVYRALSDAEQLREWFAEYADVDLVEGGVVRFWGKYTLGAPAEEQASQVITSQAPNETLACDYAFGWPWFLDQLRALVAPSESSKSYVQAAMAASSRGSMWRI